MKTIVVHERDQNRVPFLRGILTRSLLDAGLDFEDAFAMATELRDDLADFDEVSSGEIRRRVSRLLEKNGHLGAMEPYRLPLAAPARIQVFGRGDSVSAFSRELHERFLRASGLRPDKAEHITDMLFEQLLAAGASSIGTAELGYLTYLCLLQEQSRKAARRYLVWSEFQNSSRPLLLLICGAVGSGKSTMASEASLVLDIVRTQSTDMLREVMRVMIPERLLPVLHRSSFEAWRALPVPDVEERDRDQLVADGYSSQTDLLAVACEAVMQRAIAESVPLILEGVHAHPDLLERIPEESGAIAVHVTLAVLKAKTLKARLRGRGRDVPQRQARRYLDGFDSVWALQSFLLSEADRCNTAIITNHDMEKAVQQLIQQVNSELCRHFEGAPRDVFGDVVDRVHAEMPDGSWREALPALVA